MRRAAKVDRNQPKIVAALRAYGCQVECLHAIGGGVTDLLVLDPSKDLHIMEVKDGELPPSARRLTPDQIVWHLRWANPNLHVVLDEYEALAAIGAKR